MVVFLTGGATYKVIFFTTFVAFPACADEVKDFTVRVTLVVEEGRVFYWTRGVRDLETNFLKLKIYFFTCGRT